MKKILTAGVCALIVSSSGAYGAEYLIYKDPAGNIVLSNLTAPPAAEIIERYDWQDVSDDAVRAAQERDHRFWLGLKTEQLAESYEKLAESNNRLAQAVAAGRAAEPDIVFQVAQTVQVPQRRFHPRRLDMNRLPTGRTDARNRSSGGTSRR